MVIDHIVTKLMDFIFLTVQWKSNVIEKGHHQWNIIEGHIEGDWGTATVRQPYDQACPGGR